MTFEEIRLCPTTFVFSGEHGVHESIFRSYQILELVKGYLRRGVPSDVVLEIIEELEA